jgi:hypothetical protein
VVGSGGKTEAGSQKRPVPACPWQDDHNPAGDAGKASVEKSEQNSLELLDSHMSCRRSSESVLLVELVEFVLHTLVLSHISSIPLPETSEVSRCILASTVGMKNSRAAGADSALDRLLGGSAELTKWMKVFLTTRKIASAAPNCWWVLVVDCMTPFRSNPLEKLLLLRKRDARLAQNRSLM